MRIAFITPEYISEDNFDGGLANYLHRVCKLLKKQGHEPVVIVGSNENNIIEYDGIEVHRVNIIVRWPYIWSCRLKKRMFPWYDWIVQSYRLNKRLRYLHGLRPFDVAQYASYSATSIFRPRNIPAIVRISSFQRLLDEAYKSQKTVSAKICCWLEMLGFKRSDLLIGPGRMVAEAVETAAKKSVRIVETPFIMYDGKIDTYFYDQNLTGKKYLLFFGTIGILKGADVIAEILSKLFESYNDLYFAFVGKNGSIHNESMMDHIFNKAGIYRDRVLYLQRLRHCFLYPVLEHAEAVVLPSRVDNFPNVCIEAMAMGKIVIGTRGTSFEQLIADKESGFLCDIDDGNGLLATIECVLALSPEQKNVVALKAKKRIEPLCSGEVIESLLESYREAIKLADAAVRRCV